MDRHDEDPTNASGTEISRNISKLAERRTDIFGVGAQGAEQTIIGKKLGEEDRTLTRPDPKIWDGVQATIEATTRAAQIEEIDKQINQNISEIHKQVANANKGPKIGISAAPTPMPPVNIFYK